MKSVSFVGVGGAGGNFVSFLSRMEPKWKTIAINHDAVTLNKLGNCEKLLINKQRKADLWLSLEKEVEESNAVCLIIGAGGETAGQVTEKVIKQLQGLGKKVWVVAITPFGFERKESGNREIQLEKAFVEADKIFNCSNEKMLAKYIGDKLSMPQLFEKINRAIYESLQKQVKSFEEVETA